MWLRLSPRRSRTRFAPAPAPSTKASVVTNGARRSTFGLFQKVMRGAVCKETPPQFRVGALRRWTLAQGKEGDAALLLSLSITTPSLQANSYHTHSSRSHAVLTFYLERCVPLYFLSEGVACGSSVIGWPRLGPLIPRAQRARTPQPRLIRIPFASATAALCIRATPRLRSTALAGAPRAQCSARR